MTNDFFCTDCQEDKENLKCDLISNRWVKWYQTKCPDCDRRLIRYKTNNKIDPYYYRSPKVKKIRVLLEKDLIQPSDPRFKKVYKKEAEEIEQNSEKLVKKQKDKEIHNYKKNKAISQIFGDRLKKTLEKIDNE